MRRVVIARLAIGAAVLAAVGVLAAGIIRRRRVGMGAGSGPAVIPPAPASPAWLRRFVTTRFDPVVVRLGLVGGRRSPWAYLEHVGRRSGITYRTPVLPRLKGDHAYVPLPYGTDVHWARNVRAAGHCRIQVHETTYELDEPAIVTAAEHPDVPAAFRPWLERRGNRYLRLHVLAVSAGTLDDVPAASRGSIPVGAEPTTPTSA